MKNPEFDNGLNGWNVVGMGRVSVRRSKTGNNFIVAYNRNMPNDSFSQELDFKKGIYYTFSGSILFYFIFMYVIVQFFFFIALDFDSIF